VDARRCDGFRGNPKIASRVAETELLEQRCIGPMLAQRDVGVAPTFPGHVLVSNDGVLRRRAAADLLVQAAHETHQLHRGHGRRTSSPRSQ
jgi:hypothetical protein